MAGALPRSKLDAISAVKSPIQPPSVISGNAGNQFGWHAICIGMINSGTRQSIPTGIVSAIVSPTIDVAYSSMVELNSHAETSMLGANFRVIAYTEEECNISPYHPDYPQSIAFL